MGVPPIRTQPLTLDLLHRLLDPGRVFYRPAVDDILHRGEVAEIQALLKGAKEVKAQYGGLDGLIQHLEAAAKKAG
ncbi:MAG: hypothetical protein JOZ90_09485 [Alphaproteobacteria bacterium]|nr:hypothetical protein [Alphaproteobacteria bacterium]MBV9371869.1 hypothetical protein [Alphaproteobacteria bacterium]MBV9901316.1 hypothetical protein [Alphaproteobacteria bacterium]